MFSVIFDRIPAQKMMFPIKDFFSKYDEIRRKLMESFVFCAVHSLDTTEKWSFA